MRVLMSGAVAGAALVVTLAGASSTRASTPASCTPSQLTVHLGAPRGTAGTLYSAVIFTNRGASCALWGVPTIQPVTARTRRALGPSARNLSIGMMPARHVIARGQSVSAAMGVVDTNNYPARLCAARSAGGVVVSLGDFVHSRFVRRPLTVCTRRSSVTTRLLVSGTTGV